MSGDRPDADGPDDASPADDVPEQLSVEDELERAMDAAREALARAKAGAAARGLRPGAPGRVRRKRVAGEARSSAGADERDPQSFGTGMERLVADRGWNVDVAVGGVMGRWSRVVGDQVAEHCTPESFNEGVLVVRADSTVWATQVRLLLPTVQRRLAEELGEGVVEQIRVLGPTSPTWRKGARTVRGRGPRDTYG
ncbi:DUF721 domain-containing protein [Angustibacter luteus]|uniref:DUF721 domain-containing protein n=1 Tax=Angustibacter luteus TaxID=658456 RepID=A0ABW1JD41_9ACTN